MHNQTIDNNERSRQKTASGHNALVGQKHKGFLTQVKIDKRRSMQKGTRFAYALDYINKNEKISEVNYQDSMSDCRMRNVLTPVCDSVAITGPSTQYNYNSKLQIKPEGLTCFGNPTLETLQIQQKLPTLELPIQQTLKKKVGGTEQKSQQQKNQL